jgi:lipid-binding SYLF domain-containing protein
MKNVHRVLAGFLIFWACAGFAAQVALAATAREIDAGADAALERLYDEVKGSKALVQDAKGVLIFPAVFKAGIGIGGEYGEGALRMHGRTVDYYSTAAASLGLQLGAQKKSIVVLFMQDQALKRFTESSGWKAGVDASIAVVTVGAGGAMDTAKLKEPILAFIFGQKGLMYNLTLEGAKFSRIKK